MTLTLEQPATWKPGIYRDLPAATYHAIDAASNSRLTLLKRSPAHMKAAIDCPEESTPAQIVGEACHLCILEPERFVSRYAVAPECDRRTKEGKATWQAFLDSCNGKSPLSAADYEKCERMHDAVWSNPAARELLEFCRKEFEVSAIWTDEATGVLCKARADGLCSSRTFIDLKTTTDASEEAFERSIFNYGYYRQGAHYLDGFKREHFAFIAVEKDPPYANAVYQLESEVIDKGRAELERLLAIYAECERTGIYPGYESGVRYIGVPVWAATRIG